MALTGGVRVEGLNRLTRDLLTLGLEVEDLKDAFSDIADEGARTASSFAPKRSGNLAATIRGNRAKNKAIVTAGRSRVPYAGAINYGWPVGKRNWAARPRRSGGWPVGIQASSFMQKTDAVMQPYALRRLEDSITEAIRERGLA